MGLFDVASTQAAVITSTGNQTFTASNYGGGIPKAAIFMMGDATSVDTRTSDARFGYGVAISTTKRWALGGQSENGSANSDTDSFLITDGCMQILSDGGAVVGKADFVSFGVNNVTIDWTTAPFSAHLLTVVLIGGSGVTVDAGTYNPNAALDGVTVVSGLTSSARKIVFHAGNGEDPTASIPGHRISLGYAFWDGSSIVQGQSAFNDRHAVSTTATNSFIGPDRVFFEIINTGALRYSIELTAFSATSFDATTRNTTGDASNVLGYLVLNVPNTIDASIAVIDTPTSTGNQAFTGTGHEPSFGMLLQTYARTANFFELGAAAGAFGVGVFTATDEHSVSFTSEDGAATTSANSYTSTDTSFLEEGDLSSTIESNFVSMDSDGYTLNFTAVDTTTKKWLALTIGVVAAPPAGGNPSAISWLRRRERR